MWFMWWFKLLTWFVAIAMVVGKQVPCNHENALLLSKGPSYNFAMEVLDIMDLSSEGHFVFSPLASWLQLMNVLEGASGYTQKEILKATGHHPNLCYRRKLREALNGLLGNSSRTDYSIISLIIVDELLGVRKEFKDEVTKTKTLDVLALDFVHPNASAKIANQLVEKKTGGIFKDMVFEDDFQDTYFLTYDFANYKSAWMQSFDPLKTKMELFYGPNGKAIGYVRMMNTVGQFYTTSFPHLNLNILELPSDKNNQVSMLVFLPQHQSYDSVFANLNKTNMAGILNSLKKEAPKSVAVSLPKFELQSLTSFGNSEMMYYDMGMKSMFYLDNAQLGGISKYKINVSMMLQFAAIAVEEGGVAASSGSVGRGKRDLVQFKADRPFGFAIVDKKTEFILFAGMYSGPRRADRLLDETE